MYAERPGGELDEPTSTANTSAQNLCDFFAYNGAAWTTIYDEYGIAGQAWMLRGYITTASGKEVALGQGDFNNTGHKDYSNAPSIPTGVGMVAASQPNTKFPVYANPDSRALQGYNVYRGPCGGAAEDMTFIGYTLDQQYTDNTWGIAEPGVYTWAVEAVYDYNTSSFTYSNCLDKDMITQVSVTVTTNSGDSPEGTNVVFTNTSEPDMELTYDVDLDATGYYEWADFRKGTYDIMVHKNGFADIMETGVEIMEPSDFYYTLEEMLAPPSDLYVTPTGFATWRKGGIVPFVPTMETFDEGLPETWTVIAGGSTGEADTWYWTTDDAGNTLNGTPFMFVDSDAAGSGSTMDEMLVSPVYENTENADQLYLSFEYIYQYISNEYFEVDVFDGSDWVNVFHTEEDSGPYPWGPTITEMIDVSEYANADFQVRFHYVSNGWNWYVAVDNVMVTDQSDKYADRALEYYKVFLDNNFITDTDTTFYQYGDNGEVLVPGQTYLAEVAAVYSTGISERMAYEWTYYPCDSFPGPAVFTAENVESTNNVLLTWSDILPMQLVEVTQNPGEPANGYFQSFDYGYGVVYDLAAYPDALANSIEFHHASWGTTGTWEYNIHIVDWDTKTAIAELGPFTTTGNDLWETGIDLGDIDLMGATSVAFLMEPLGNVATDAYPDLSSDNATNPQGSVYGPLADNYSGIGSSTIGNFLMNIYIMTANGKKVMAPRVIDIPAASVAATPRVNTNATASVPVIDNQTAKSRVDDVFVGANLYRDGMMIAEAVTDTSYLDEGLEAGYYDYCITYLYESGAESCLGSMCVNDVLVPENCVVPVNLTAELSTDERTAILDWNTFSGSWLSYGDGPYVAGIGLNPIGPVTVAIQFDPSDLTDYVGMEFSKINFRYGNAIMGNILVQIWEDDVLILEETTSGLVANDWNEVSYDSPVVIAAGKTYKIGYTTSDWDWNPDGPAGAQDFTGSLKSDLVLLNGVWDNLSNYLPNSWLLEAYVSPAGPNAQSASIQLESSVEYSAATASDLVAVTAEPVYDNRSSGSRAFVGYNVYRDGELVNSDPIAENHYEDTPNAAPGYFCYTVTAVYSICGETDPSNEACIDIPVSVNELGANEVSVYPNPANDRVNIVCQDMKDITVFNYVGQVVFRSDLGQANSTQLNTSKYESGVYVVRISTENGVVTKRVIINR